ncbi:hypothetical protein MRS76_22425 [Rhizobiaceae bacterium n13]|uniref:Uncharacterized protein n=1 Tax=Ferirhizobium litorale TaxID=2927786 RepID=A0AAE3QBU9_9HYPH|nr:hypothetical protein [Fererhizobium litorale]MDI7922180.1 hypothetical protein [Fererhizobium litorale]
MSRPVTGEPFRKFRVVNSVTVDGVEAYHRTSVLRHHENTKMVALLKLVCGLLKEVVDLLNAARKSRPIMS